MDEKYILKIQENEDRSKSNQRRIEDLENDVKNNNILALNVRELTIEIKHMREDYQTLAQKHNEEVKVLDSRLSSIENKPANDFEKIKWIIITRYSFCCTGFFIRPNRIIRSEKYGTIFNMGSIKRLCHICWYSFFNSSIY